MSSVRLADNRRSVIVSGPLFERSRQAITEACSEGLRLLADIGTDTMRYAMLNAQVVRTGRTIGSIRAIQRRSKPNALGYWIITPTDVWSGELLIRHVGSVIRTTRTGRQKVVRRYQTTVTRSDTSGRPTRTWLAHGTRRGVKLRAAQDFYQRTATGLRRVRYSGVFLPLLEQRLND